MLSAHVSATNSFKFTKPFLKNSDIILLSSDGLATFGAILIEILEIFLKSSDCLAIRVGNRNSDKISCLLTNINFSYGQKLHDSQIILQKFWSELWSDNRHVFNGYFIRHSQYVRFVILCALYVTEKPFSPVFFPKTYLSMCIKQEIAIKVLIG